MATIPKKNLTECLQPEDPQYGTTYCYYEYACFMDCSAASLTAADPSIGMVEAEGTITTYTPEGTRTFAEGEIAGTPYSKPILLGLMSDDWHDHFIKPENAAHLNLTWESENNAGWVYADHHNGFPLQHRFKLAKFLLAVPHILTKEELEDEEGEPIEWECPADPEFEPPAITQQDWIDLGYKCPPYYEMKPCTDCNDVTQEIETLYWEMVDGTMLMPPITRASASTLNANGQYNCYTPKEIKGPRGNENYYTLKLEQQHADGDFDAQLDCQDCKIDYLLAISSVANIDAHDAADPDWIDNILGNEVQVTEAVSEGWVAYKRSVKSEANKKFVADNGNTFYYKGLNNNCYKLVIMDPSSYVCIPLVILNFSRWYMTPQSNATIVFNPSPDYIDISLFETIYGGACDCDAAGGSLGRGDTYDICHPPEAPPVIIKHPENAIAGLQQGMNAAPVNFSITAEGIGLSYAWHVTKKNGEKAIYSATGDDLSLNVGTEYDDARVYCVVSNNDGKTKITSISATITVNNAPSKIMDENEEVQLVLVSVYVVSQPEWNNLPVRKLPPSSALKGKVYRWIKPMTGPAREKEYLFEFVANYKTKFSHGHADGYSTGYVYYKIIGIETRKWGDLTDTLRGINPARQDFEENDTYGLPGPSLNASELSAAM